MASSSSSQFRLLIFLFLRCFLVATSAQKGPKVHVTSSFPISNSSWSPSLNLTLFSPDLRFAAGFRPSPSDPTGLYVFSVWLQSSSEKTVTWSLNPRNPVPSSASLSVSGGGGLTTTHNYSPAPSGLSILLTLSDDGSLTMGGWNSLRYPTDTVLTNQQIPANGTTLTSASGRFRLVNASALVFNGTDTYWQSQGNSLLNLTADGNLHRGDGSSYLMSDVKEDVMIRRLTLDWDGNLRVYSLNETKGSWKMVWQAVLEPCTIKGTCSLNQICVPDGNSTACVCGPGYRDGGPGQGCRLKMPYVRASKFLRLDYVSFDTDDLDENAEHRQTNFDQCRANCSADPSCVAFSYQFGGGRDCFNHFRNLRFGYWSPATEKVAFLRVSASESDRSNFTGMQSIIDTTCPIKIGLPTPPKESKTTAINLAIIGTLFALELLAGILSFWAFLRKYSKYRDMAHTFGLEFLPAGGPKRFSYAELKTATNDFSDAVGRGGFGVVYKGRLNDGRIIAVKRLKTGTGGGEAEFWGEVTIIARMHHLNLVRMWGFCAEKEQRMLVYEYISNGSLDKFLFQEEEKSSPRQKPILEWNVRYRIALGVARAIAYLHEECLEWVLHCDIKPENILLEDDFCPKVSDFGLSKLTNKKDIVTMSRIRGTRGYLAPEWVTHHEPITAKADVYSFGVVLLEIVTGTRSSRFQRASRESEDWYFPRWAFEKVYIEQKVEDLLDPVILESYDDRTHLAMVERMVKTAMWCLQDRAETRPSMGKVAKMIEGSVEITEPEKPSIFYLGEESMD